MPYRILVVDDSRLTRAVIKNALAEAGHEVVGEAQNGREAVDKYDMLKPDAVTMYLVMPEMDGLEATREIVAKDPAARILVVTSLDQKLLEDDAAKIGAKGMLAKPFQPSQLVRMLNGVLGVAK
ncbi:MAG: response regulator [Elusimicrobia bacterium]|nr:response regulator [Elusimicrobiota bacterium]